MASTVRGSQVESVGDGRTQKASARFSHIPRKYEYQIAVAKPRRFPELGVEGWRLYACISEGDREAAWTSVVVVLPESTVKALRVRQLWGTKD